MDGESRTGQPLKAAVKSTYEDYRTTSDDQRYELLDGDLISREGRRSNTHPRTARTRVSHEAVGVRPSTSRPE